MRSVKNSSTPSQVPYLSQCLLLAIFLGHSGEILMLCNGLFILDSKKPKKNCCFTL